MYETNLTEQRKRVNRYSHLENVIAELESTLSRERLGTYLRAVPNRDREQALRLYLWSVALSCAFYGAPQGLEVTLRNAMHKQLASRYGSAW